MFIDSGKIYVKAGDGGKGCQSFYRDKYTRYGIPDGGDGGRGADIIVRADRNLSTLLDFRYNRHFIGHHGGHASSKKQKGRDAQPVVIRVPVGTVLTDALTGCLLRDLANDGDELIVASGGKGGKGNHHHCEATGGEVGQERHLQLELKVLADVGVVGFPNAGKSTLITAISNARPQIAAYPFTTKAPVLGAVRSKKASFVVADIPGLIAGASRGRGLGDQFLRHVERTRLLVHVIDMAGFEGRDPRQDYQTINQELVAYSKTVGRKPQIIVANKMDLAQAAGNLDVFRRTVRRKVYPISALEGQGLEELIEAIGRKLRTPRH